MESLLSVVKLGFFASKTCSKVFQYSTNDPKVCKEAVIGRGKNLKTIYQSISCLFDDQEATVGECLQCMKENTNKVEENVVVRTNCHCKEEFVGPVQEKSQ